MTRLTTRTILGASLLAFSGTVLLSGAAMAATCGPGYKPVKWQNSGNTVCILDVAAGNNTLANPGSRPRPGAKFKNRKMKIKTAPRRYGRSKLKRMRR